MTRSHRYGCLLLMALMCVVSSAQTPQTARDYFNELRDANAFNHYGDEYVCFPDKDTGSFAVVARTKDIEKMSAANNKGAKQKSLGNALVVQPYYKGVASATQVLEKTDKESDGEWGAEFKSPMHGKIVYRINWVTGRYRYLVYDLDHSKSVPAAEISGKCELIHPWSPPPE